MLFESGLVMSVEVHQFLVLLSVVLGSYLLGAVNSALIISRVFDLKDPRTEGSGNPGATNMLRVSENKRWAAMTLVGDAGKGALAVWLAYYLAGESLPSSWPSPELVAAVMAVAGHVWPVYYRFQGGKGVATLAGVMAVLNPLLLAMGLATWLFGYVLYRRVSAASIAVGAALPLYAWAVHRDWDLVLVGLFLGIVIVYRHQENLRRLLRGEED